MDQDRRLYIGGQKVEGHISLHLILPTRFSLLKVRFQGRVATNLENGARGGGGVRARTICSFTEEFPCP
jgi:hypothetical protein